MAKFICMNCHEEKEKNCRLADGIQQYCGKPICQQARKTDWQRKKMHNDSKYRNKQIKCLEHWRKHRPLDQYQSQYRESNPDYAEKNRQQQRLRNKKRQSKADLPAKQQIVKMDPSQIQIIESGTYQLTPVAMDGFKKIVKMDALIVQLNILHKDNQQIPL